ncbi:MAG: hypothetical protein ABEK50_06200 [bacterium]
MSPGTRRGLLGFLLLLSLFLILSGAVPGLKTGFNRPMIHGFHDYNWGTPLKRIYGDIAENKFLGQKELIGNQGPSGAVLVSYRPLWFADRRVRTDFLINSKNGLIKGIYHVPLESAGTHCRSIFNSVRRHIDERYPLLPSRKRQFDRTNQKSFCRGVTTNQAGAIVQWTDPDEEHRILMAMGTPRSDGIVVLFESSQYRDWTGNNSESIGP